MNNVVGSDVRASKVKDMDLLKSLVADGEEEEKGRGSGMGSASSVTSSSSSSMTSSSGLSYVSSVSENTKKTADTNTGAAENPSVAKPEQNSSDTSDIDDDFYDTGVQKTRVSQNASESPPLVNGHANRGHNGTASPEDNTSRDGDDLKEQNDKKETSTFSFTLDLKGTENDGQDSDTDHREKPRGRARGARRVQSQPRKKHPGRGRPTSPKNNKGGSGTSPKDNKKPFKENDNRQNDFRISPWDYGDSAPSTTKTATKPKKRRATKPRPPIDHRQFQQDRQKMLEHKYEELRELLSQNTGNNNQELDRELLLQTKQILGRYRMLQDGNIPGGVVAPPSGRPPTGRRRVRVCTPLSEGVTSQTQTDYDESHVLVNAEGDTVYIDMTKNKHVTFAHGYSESAISKASVAPVTNHEPPADVKSAPQVIQKKPRASRPVSAKRQITRGRPSEESASPFRRRQRQHRSASSSSWSSGSSPSPTRNRRLSDASDSEYSSTSRSRSRSTEKTFVASDHNLKSTKDPKILEWLRKKNRLIRKQRAAERKKERAKEKAESKKVKDEEERRLESEKKVKEWMQEKRLEVRLLRKRERQEKSPNVKSETSAVIDQTLDLKIGAATLVEHPTQVIGHAMDCEKRSSEANQGKTITIDVNTKEDRTLKCTCGFEVRQEQERQSRLSASRPSSGLRKISHPDYSIRRRPMSAKRASLSPKRSKKNKAIKEKTDGSQSDSNVNQGQDKQRISYDEWVRQKRKQDIKREKEDRAKHVKQLSRSDPEAERVISEVGRRRIDMIKNGKTRIDTGIKSVDDKANAYPEGECAGEDATSNPDDSPTSPKPARYSWKLDDGSTPQRPSTAKVTSQSPTRPASSRVRPASAPRGRPASARKYFRAPVPPKPSKSPAPGNDLDEGVVMPGSPRRRAKSPKPDVVTSAYKKVRNQQGSWDEFSDYVWDKINEDEGAEMKDDGQKPQTSGGDDSQADQNPAVPKEENKSTTDSEEAGPEKHKDVGEPEVSHRQLEDKYTAEAPESMDDDDDSSNKSEDDSQGEDDNEDKIKSTDDDSTPPADEQEHSGNSDNSAPLGDEQEHSSDEDKEDDKDPPEKNDDTENQKEVEEPEAANSEQSEDHKETEKASKRAGILRTHSTPEIVIDTVPDMDNDSIPEGDPPQAPEMDNSAGGADDNVQDGAASPQVVPQSCEPIHSPEDPPAAQPDDSESGLLRMIPNNDPGKGDQGPDETAPSPEKHTPCILDITKEGGHGEPKPEKHVTFMTAGDDEQAEDMT